MRIVYGRHPVEALLECRPGDVRRLFVSPDGLSSDSISSARRAGVPIDTVPKERLESMAKSSYHQGLVAEAADFPYASLDAVVPAGRAPLVLALDSIQDPQNLGALIRSAEALGATGVVIPQDRAVPVTGTVGKASAGAIERLPISRVVNLGRALGELKEHGVWVTGLAGEGEAVLSSVDLTGASALVVGAEGTGLRPGIRKACDHLVRIPMTGGTASLNASVAGGIALYEAAIQRSRRAGGKTA